MVGQMNIFKNEQVCDISTLITQAEHKLKTDQIYLLSTFDHLEHFAVYLAWQNVGCNIFVKSPMLPQEHSDYVMCQLKSLSVKNSILFHTSGTTGYPKVVVNTQQQINEAIRLSSKGLHWSKVSHFMNFLPASTSGFWHIVMPAVVNYDCDITLGNKETFVKDITNKVANRTILVAGLINMLTARNISADLSHFDIVGVGASAVEQRHVEYVFNNGAKNFAHLYGATEICSPILSRITSMVGDYNEYLPLTPDTKLVNGELWVRGASLCNNYKDFTHDGEWFKTGDLWESKNNLIKFVGRSNDIVKINGYQCNLLLVENVVEQQTDLGECLAVTRQTLGSDWIEVLYTNKNATINKKQFSEQFKSMLPKHSIPRKYTYVNEIVKNALGKKIRHG